MDSLVGHTSRMSLTRDEVSQDKPPRTRELWAVGLLTIGLVTGPFGLAIGLYLVATSKLWSSSQKLLAVAMPAAAFTLMLLLSGAVGGYSCAQISSGPEVCEPHMPLIIAWALLIAIVVVLLVMPVYLLRAANRR
jgi:hypothetical protein